MSISSPSVFPGAKVIPSPWWGYPTIGHARQIKPTILAQIHVTAGLSSAEDTTTWGISTKNRSWTFCINRDGSVVQSLDPVTQVAWTGGDLRSPDLSNPFIAAAAASRYNFNEACFLTIENVGTPDSHPITAAQRESIRQILKWGSKLSGLPIERRRVIGHYQINSETRVNCPVMKDQRTAFFADLLETPEDDENMLPMRRKAQVWKTNKNAKVYLSPSMAEAFATIPAGTYVPSIAEQAERQADGTWKTIGPMRQVVLGDDRTGFVNRADIDPVPADGFDALNHGTLMEVDTEHVPAWPLKADDGVTAQDVADARAKGIADAAKAAASVK